MRLWPVILVTTQDTVLFISVRGNTILVKSCIRCKEIRKSFLWFYFPPLEYVLQEICCLNSFSKLLVLDTPKYR